VSGAPGCRNVAEGARKWPMAGDRRKATASCLAGDVDRRAEASGPLHPGGRRMTGDARWLSPAASLGSLCAGVGIVDAPFFIMRGRRRCPGDSAGAADVDGYRRRADRRDPRSRSRRVRGSRRPASATPLSGEKAPSRARKWLRCRWMCAAPGGKSRETSTKPLFKGRLCPELFPNCARAG
jgi:hypothetical protein